MSKVSTVKSKLLLLIFNLILSLQLVAQAPPSRLEQFINSAAFPLHRLHFAQQVKKFYTYNGYRFCWMGHGESNRLQILSAYFAQSPRLGLDKEDYQSALGFQENVNTLANERDSLLAEIYLTDATLHFISDVLTGNQPEPLSYNGLSYSPSCNDISLLLFTYLDSGRFSSLLNEIDSRDALYVAVKKKLNFFQDLLASRSFREVMIRSGKVNAKNKALISRLHQFGFLATDTAMVADSVVKAGLKGAQGLLSLLNDGVLRPTSIQALNVPIAVRVQELALTLNALRWLSCIKQGPHMIVVNIPSATLLVFENGKVVLESRVIVGKPSTPTPTLCSKITEAILYPYWNVPNKIATKELLPLIKRNPGYLEANNYQVLNKQAKVINPANINWHSLSRTYFPYVIRQSTGCDNSLGLIKLNFYNPFTVYLHDTPVKSLFMLNRRYFSHGCMRLQKAMETAHYVLKGNTIAIDTLEQKGCLTNQSPITVPATEKIPVFVLYHTAWFDSTAVVTFHEDVYQKLAPVRKKQSLTNNANAGNLPAKGATASF